MIVENTRDAAATVVVLAFFASTWFGWAQEHPPKRWPVPLTVASVGSVLLATFGAVLTWQRWDTTSVFDQAGTPSAFGIVVGIEVAVGGLGALLLSRTGRTELTPVWIALVVGVHFVPLAPLLDSPLLYVTAAAVVAAAAAAMPIARARQLPLSAVTGLGTGCALLATALLSLTTVL